MEVYISRDENDDFVYVWKKPIKGNFKPEQFKSSKKVNYQRTESMDELDSYDIYHIDDFRKKFKLEIAEKSLTLKNLPDNMVNDESFKLFSYREKWKNVFSVSPFKKKTKEFPKENKEQ